MRITTGRILVLPCLQTSGVAIEHIKNPSEEVQLAAVKQDGWVIRYIKNPSKKVQLAAGVKGLIILLRRSN